MKQKEKIHYKDIEETTGSMNVKVFKVGDKEYNSMRTSKMNLASHYDCETCGKEYELNRSYYRTCPECRRKELNSKYYSLGRIDWDGETPLCLYDSEEYFFDVDGIIQYCEDNDYNPSDLMFLECYQSSFRQIDLEQISEEVVHEDWEPSDGMIRKLDEFNKFLQSEPTRTWFPGNNRVTLIWEDLK